MYFGYQALKCLNSQKKLDARHIKWIEFLQGYTFALKHCAGIENKVADVLSRVVGILHSVEVIIVGFECIKNKYAECKDFGEIYGALMNNQIISNIDFVIHDSYLFKGTRLYIPTSFFRDFVI